MPKLSLMCLPISAVLVGATSDVGSGMDDTDWAQGAACYGFGGGHGVWKCGTSKAWCTKIGGVARYLPDYRSRRSGACMCKDGCTSADAIVPGFSKDGSHDGFACYNSGGNHEVKCGMSKADCEGLGGYSYPPSYVSTRSGCCMCEDNCNKDLETGTCDTYTSTVVSSPTPPPKPPSPPPSPSFPPVLGDSAAFETITVTMNVTGTIESYTDAKAALIAEKFAIACGVHADDIAVSFAAGSVIITVAIKVPITPNDEAVSKVKTALAGPMEDATAMSNFLGGSYGSILYRQSVNSVGTLEVATTGGGLGTGVLIAIIVGVIVVVAVLALVVKMMMGGKKGPSKGGA